MGGTPEDCQYDDEFRTGFVIARRHVLTAAHCVRELDREPLWLRLPAKQVAGGLSERHVFVPVRVADMDEALDAAVLDVDAARLEDAGWDFEPLGGLLDAVAVPVGVPVSAGWAIRTEGFPASNANPHGTVFGGVVEDPDGRLQRPGQPPVRVAQLSLRPLGAAAPESPKGHSGGPVLFEAGSSAGTNGPARAIGVVRTYPSDDEDRWTALGATIYATRVDDLARRFPVVADAVAHAAQSRLEAVTPPRAVGSGSLVRLLRADTAPTRFRGRDGERAMLHGWCGSAARRSAWLMVGPAGQGKTRLAAQFAAELTDAGDWLTGLFRGSGDLDTVREALAAAELCGRSVLLTVDYAAEHGAAALNPLIQMLAGSPVRWRMLLLARTAGDWWTDSTLGVRSRLEDADAEVPSHPLDLDLLERTPAGRHDAFGEIVEALRAPVRAFATAHGLRFVAEPAVPPLGRPEFGSALMLHVTAVCGLLPASQPGDPTGPDVGISPQPRAADLLGRVIDLECRYHWLYQDDAGQLYPTTSDAFGTYAAGSQGRRLVERAVATATLFGGASLREATAVLAAALAISDQVRLEAIARWLHDLYPPGADSDSWLPGLQPDLLGEELVARVIHHALDSDREAFTETLPYQVLTGREQVSATNGQVQRMLTILTRTATRHGRIACVLDGATATSPLLHRIPSSYDLAPVEAALPYASTNLLAFRVQLTRRLLDRHLDGLNAAASDSTLTHLQIAELARLYHNLASRLAQAGQLAQALGPAQEAVELYRRLADDAPHACLPYLAQSLTNLASRLSEAGRREESLGPAQEAVKLYQELAADAPDAHLPNLAGSLTNLANSLSELRLPAQALNPAREAVKLYQELAADAPDAHLPNLAGALINLANRLAELGRPAQALDPAQEAVELYRRLAAEFPDAYLSDLALSLNNLAAFLSGAGRRAQALGPAQEAVEIRRRLAADAPDAYLPYLAMSLTNLATSLAEVGLRAEALVPAQEAVELYRALTADAPDAHLPNLAMSLANLAARLSGVGRRAQALGPAQETVEIRRRLAADTPDAHLPDLAKSLTHLATVLREVGRRAEALGPAQESVDLFRRLVADAPDIHLPDLAASLSSLAAQLCEVGRRAEALGPAQESVDLFRRLAADAPDVHLPSLASSLNNLATSLSEVGQWTQALGPAQEAVNIRRRLAADAPDAHIPDLAMSLNNLANRLSDVGQPGQALGPAQESVDLYRRLAADAPDAHLPNLAMSLNNLAKSLSEGDQPERALGPAQESVDLYRRLAAEAPDIHLPNLAMSLNNLAARLVERGRPEEALAPAQGAVESYRALAADVPDTYLRDLAGSLTNLSLSLSGIGQPAQALDLAQESVELFRRLAADHPAVHLPNLAMSLTNLANRLADVGRDNGEAVVDRLIAEFPILEGRAYLLSLRAGVAERPYPRRVVEALQALESLDEVEAPMVLAEVHRRLRALRAEDPASFDRFWLDRYTDPQPAWVNLADDFFKRAVDWMNSQSIQESAAYLKRHRDLLGPAGLSAIDEISLDYPGNPQFDAYRQLLAIAIAVGVDRAYAPILAADVSQT